MSSLHVQPCTSVLCDQYKIRCSKSVTIRLSRNLTGWLQTSTSWSNLRYETLVMYVRLIWYFRYLFRDPVFLTLVGPVTTSTLWPSSEFDDFQSSLDPTLVYQSDDIKWFVNFLLILIRMSFIIFLILSSLMKVWIRHSGDNAVMVLVCFFVVFFFWCPVSYRD